MILRITAPYFCAAAITREDKVYRAAPILNYMIGWNEQTVISYCKKKGWKIEKLQQKDAPDGVGQSPT